MSLFNFLSIVSLHLLLPIFKPLPSAKLSSACQDIFYTDLVVVVSQFFVMQTDIFIFHKDFAINIIGTTIFFTDHFPPNF